jgi:uncharacterized membrane protein YoaK (UPF0700 family)
MNMPPRPVMAFVAAFILGGARAEDDLSVSMLILWFVVGLVLGYRLALSQAPVTGAIYGAGLGFASGLYGRGPQNLLERVPVILVGMVVGALCGAAVVSVGSAVSERMLGAARKHDVKR